MNPRKKDTNEKKKVKPACPEGEQCREMRQDHFRELSHYHLEKYLAYKLWKDLVIPRPLPFNRWDRGIFSQQIRNLQVVMQEAYNKGQLGDLYRQIEAERLEELNQPPIEATSGLIVVKTENLMESSKRSAPTSPPVDQKRSKTTEPVENKTESWKLSLCKEFDELTITEDCVKYFIIATEKMKELNEATLHLKSPGCFLTKYEKSKPYNVFLSSLQDVQMTWNQKNSITFPEILDISLGKIVKSFYIANRVDIDWLRFQYLLAGQKTDCFIICRNYFCTGELPGNIEVHKVDKQNSQIIVLKYTNGVRIIINGGNIEERDWKNVTQVVWISPHLPHLTHLKDTGLGESKSGFKKDFLNYLMEYKNPCKLKIEMIEWLNVLLNHDFSLINVFFLGSVPGVYRDSDCDRWGLGKLSTLLSAHAHLPSGDEDEDENWPIVAQVPFILCLGDEPNNREDWITTEFLASLSKLALTHHRHLAPEFKCIYPSLENRGQFIEKNQDSLALWYPSIYSSAQKWLEKSLCQWKTGSKGRNKSKPGCKIYTRISELKRAPWIVVTSAALWTGGWGYQTHFRKVNNQENQQRVSNFDSFDAGIVFFPKFVTGAKTFSVQDVDEKGTPPFPIPFDVPLTPYKSTDMPCES